MYGRRVQIQVGEYFLDDRRIFDAGNHFDRPAADSALLNVDIEHTSTPKQTLKHLCLESPERLRPANGLEHWNVSFTP